MWRCIRFWTGSRIYACLARDPWSGRRTDSRGLTTRCSTNLKSEFPYTRSTKCRLVQPCIETWASIHEINEMQTSVSVHCGIITRQHYGALQSHWVCDLAVNAMSTGVGQPQPVPRKRQSMLESWINSRNILFVSVASAVGLRVSLQGASDPWEEKENRPPRGFAEKTETRKSKIQ